MNKSEVIRAIFEILEMRLQVPHLEDFREQARLNEDLYLDSVVVLQLLVQLELQFGFEIPEEEITADHFQTVSSLADFLLSLPRGAVRSVEEAS